MNERICENCYLWSQGDYSGDDGICLEDGSPITPSAKACEYYVDEYSEEGETK